MIKLYLTLMFVDKSEQFSLFNANNAIGNVLMWVCHCAVN